MLSAWIRRWRTRPAIQGAVLVLGLLLLGVFLVAASSKASRPGGYDVHCFLSAARAIRAGGDPYHVPMPIPYNYPLFAGTAAIALLLLPEGIVQVLWFLATLAAWAATAGLLAHRWARTSGEVVDRRLLFPLGLASLLLLGPIQNHLLNGQTDALVLLLCVLFWIDWHEDRPGRSAFWLGLGVSLKLVPALFFVPLLLRRSWGILSGACVWIAVLSVGFPALFLGSGVFSAYEHYARTLLLPEWNAAIHSAQYSHDYTLRGALTLVVPAWKTSLLIRGLAILLVVGPLCLLERQRKSRPDQTLAGLEAYLAGILLLAPLSQPHHLTLLLPVVWLQALRWVTPGHAGRGELLALVPFALFPLWKILGGPLEMVAVGWIFVVALSRAGERSEAEPAEMVPAQRRIAG
jgi:hypothetical protein